MPVDSMRSPSHRKVEPETPCVGCEPDNVRECTKNSGYMCKAWKVYVRYPTGPQRWTDEQRGVFK